MQLYNMGNRNKSTTLLIFLFLCLFFLMLLSPCSVAVTFLLPNDGTKCISEELHSNVVVLTDYAIHTTDEDHYPSVFLSVSGPYGNDFLSLRSVSHGNFSFTTQEAGNYMACFWVNDHYPVPGELTLTIDWKIGIAAKDWDSIAKKEKIEGVELELRKLEEVVEDIHGNLLHLKYKETEMRSVSEKTNSRVAWFSIMSLVICIGVSALQLWHLKQFFRRKKLI